MQKPRVFGVGLSKTGTTSLTRALEILGYDANHFPYSAIRFQSGQLNFDYERIGRWDAVTDSPIALFFQQLEERFPEGKFILTRRDVESWLDSCEHNHVWPGDYVRNRGIRLLPYIGKILCLHRSVYGTEHFRRDTFRRAYEMHHQAVVDHFRSRNRELLIMDICGGDGWKPLCDFLGLPVPEVPFPCENVGKFKTLKHASRRLGWRVLSLLPTTTLKEHRVQKITGVRVYND